MKLKIDNRELELDRPVSIHEAAARLGIDIPTLCYEPGREHFTSCMICMVKDKKSGRLLPACSAPVAEGMDIETLNDEIRAFRKATLELLLGDHVGDCEAPCQCLCPLHMEIPKMIREIQSGDRPEAIRTVRRDIAIASILERFCNVPCERGCRRGKHDEPLSIREMTRHVADWDLRRDSPYTPPRDARSGKRVAVVGAGPTGLSAAYYLALRGHDVVVHEKSARVGGRIEAEFKRAIEPWVIDGELALLRRLGVEIVLERAVGPGLTVPDLRTQFDAVVVACGKADAAALGALGLGGVEKGLKVNPKTFETLVAGVFAAGSVLKPGQPLIKSVGAARDLAACVDQFLRGEALTGIPDMYNHTMGRLLDGEMAVFLENADPRARVKPEGIEANGFRDGEAVDESGRCLHCDCRANQDCKLRIYSDQYEARQNQFAGEERGRHRQIRQHQLALYEPGKCIKCGLCVRVTEHEKAKFGFAFVGRGFDMKPGVALDKPLGEGFGEAAEKVIDACPTGALEWFGKVK